MSTEDKLNTAVKRLSNAYCSLSELSDKVEEGTITAKEIISQIREMKKAIQGEQSVRISIEE